MIYTSKDQILVESFVYCYDGTSLLKGKKVNLYELIYSGDPDICSMQISKAETELYQSLKLDGRIYTLFMGPMEYSNNTLRVRIGIATGIHRL